MGRAGAVYRLRRWKKGKEAGARKRERRGRRGGEELEEEGSPAARAVWPFRGKVRQVRGRQIKP